VALSDLSFLKMDTTEKANLIIRLQEKQEELQAESLHLESQTAKVC
jgi:hypothetical protein